MLLVLKGCMAGFSKGREEREWHSRAAARTLRGQGATEYLVLLAVVLIIAIVTIALLGFFPGTSSDAKISESRIYWSGVASPISIKEVQPLFTATTGSVCGTAATRGARLVLQSASVSTIILTAVNFSGTVGAMCPGGAASSSSQINLDPGANVVVDVVIGTGHCVSAGQLTDAPIKFTHNTQYLSGLTQIGSKGLAYKC